MNKKCIVTLADSNYFEMLEELIDSIPIIESNINPDFHEISYISNKNNINDKNEQPGLTKEKPRF